MSWYPVNYACGHSDRMQIYGPTKDRQRQADAESRKLCPDCYRTQRDAANAAQSAVDKAKADAAGLPALLGSDKQIAWAETIRVKMLDEVKPIVINSHAQLLLAQRGQVLLDDPRWLQIQEAVEVQIGLYRAQASAKWWIDHRQDSLHSLCVSKMAEVAKALFAPEIEAQKALLAAEADQAKATREHEAQLAREQRDHEQAVSEVAAAQFVPIRVERLNGRDVRIHGEDNHVAMAYRDDGETVVYLIDDIHITSTLPSAELLNKRIHAMVPKR